jgi:hypothetical protein
VAQYRAGKSRQALKESKWQSKITVSTGDLSGSDIFELKAIKITTIWAIDVAAAKWCADIDILGILKQMLRVAQTPSQALDVPPLTLLLDGALSQAQSRLNHDADVVKRLEHMPQELYEGILGFMPVGASNLNTHLGWTRMPSKESRYSSMWEPIFTTDDWLTMVCKEFGVNPLLMGSRKDFDCVMHSTNWTKDHPSLMLILRDKTGDAQYTKDELLKSLCHGKLHETVYELESGITLDLRNVLFSTFPEFPVYNSKLFSNGLDLSYAFWKNAEATIGSIGREELAIPRSVQGLQHPRIWNDIVDPQPFGRITTDGNDLREDWTNANHPVDKEDTVICTFGVVLFLIRLFTAHGYLCQVLHAFYPFL